MMLAGRLAGRLEGKLRGRVVMDAPLAPLTTYRLGGPAAILVEVADRKDLEVLASEWEPDGLEMLIIGRGSNLLVADSGYDGLVLRLGGAFSWARSEDDLVRAGGATPMPWLARWAARQGWGGLEFGVAVPGSVGGAVRMNAGAHGTEIKDVLAAASVQDLKAREARQETPAALGLRYRGSDLTPGELVTEGAFHLERSEPAALESALREIVRWRREHQPGGQPNAGSVFANPENDSAGRLIEAAGAKGWRVGGAEVSPKHANFFVAHEGATALDVLRLMVRVRAAVSERCGVVLRPELRCAGSFPDSLNALLKDES
jgi:UDP-N-acetylmuramate dehydrogenase